jgi:hypothetical protein
MAAVLQFHSMLVAVAAMLAMAAVWYTPRTFFEKPAGGFAGTYRCRQSPRLVGMENHKVRIDPNMNMSLIGGEVEVPVGFLTPVPGNPKLANLHLAEGMRRPGTEFNPLLVHEVEGHGRYIYLRGLQNGQELYGIACTN